MAATIRVNITKYSTVDNNFGLTVTALPETSGTPDLGLFVFRSKEVTPEFDHVSSVYDLENHPFNAPTVGNQFYRLPTVTFEFGSAFEAEDVAQRILEDLVNLEKNLDEIMGTYASNIDYEVSNGVITNIN